MLFRSDRKSTRLNSSHTIISYAVFCLKKKPHTHARPRPPRRTNRANALTHRDSTALPLGVPPVVSVVVCCSLLRLASPFFNDTATTEIYTLSLHDALPI